MIDGLVDRDFKEKTKKNLGLYFGTFEARICLNFLILYTYIQFLNVINLRMDLWWLYELLYVCDVQKSRIIIFNLNACEGL